jgi:peroxiredoxin
MRLALLFFVSAAICGTLAGCSSDFGPAKDFKVVELEDQAKVVSLADFKGKTVLLDFWATTCGPCRNSMGEIQQMWEKYQSKGFEVISITAEDRATVREFHKALPFTYPVYLDRTYEASMGYKVNMIPRFVLIRDGRVIWDQEGFSQGDVTGNVERAMGSS